MTSAHLVWCMALAVVTCACESRNDVFRCPPSATARCGLGCADVLTDPLNCGSCGTICPGTECTMGLCGCPEGTTRCDGRFCFDLASYQDHCGQCGRACSDDERCVSGDCVSSDVDADVRGAPDASGASD